MIFDGVPISQISDAQIDSLVTKHVVEQRCLDFKITILHKDDDEKLEALRDIVSFANADGGYLIVGIRDDGNGRAQKYEPELVGDIQRIRKSVMDLCNDHISERIDGLEIVVRNVKGNPLLLVRIPASDRAPHMVTYQNKTEFYTRHHDGKREMTIGEIREAFTQDLIGRRLTTIEHHLQSRATEESLNSQRARALDTIRSGGSPQLLTIENGELLSEVALASFMTGVDNFPYFWFASTPVNPRKNLIDVDSLDIRSPIQNPPGSRFSGWNMDFYQGSIERSGDGVYKGKKDYRYLHLLENGHMEFWTPLDERFCWNQSAIEFQHHPRLYPYPVTEYPTTFLRLYRAIVDEAKLEEDLIINFCYANLKGYILLPGSPSSVSFKLPFEKVPYSEENLSFRTQVSNDFEPDQTAYEVIKRVYAAFGHHPSSAIPFFDKDVGKFIFQ